MSFDPNQSRRMKGTTMTRFARFIAAASLLAVLSAALVSGAQASFIAGFLAQCTAMTSTSCTEQTETGYARQPIQFGPIANTVSLSTVTPRIAQSIPYAFAQGVTGTIAGHAIYDAPTNGNLLLLIPYAAAYTIPSIGDRGDVGSIQINLSSGANYPPDGLNAVFQTGATLGTTVLDGSTVTFGTGFMVQHGQGFTLFGDSDAATRQVTETTGFSYTVPTGVTSVDIKAAGTLATGGITLPIPLADGTLFKLACSITITTLTVTAGSGATIVGTAPTTCGTGASHELEYYAGDTSWHVLY
jgi:hypothetical protein